MAGADASPELPARTPEKAPPGRIERVGLRDARGHVVPQAAPLGNRGNLPTAR